MTEPVAEPSPGEQPVAAPPVHGAPMERAPVQGPPVQGPPAEGQPSGPGASGAEGEWQRVHPLSPLLRGGVVFLGVVSYLASQQIDRIFGAVQDDPTEGHRGLAALGVLVVLALIVLGAWVAWRTTRYRVGTAVVEQRSGVIFRQHRQVRVDRIQAVDVTRPLLARLLGLSEVRVQAAGGRDAGVVLAFLSDRRAHALREEILVRAGHRDQVAGGGARDGIPAWQGDGPATPPRDPTVMQPGMPPGRVAHPPAVVRVPNGRLVQAALYSGSTLALGLGVAVVVAAILLDQPGILPAMGPAVLGGLIARLRQLAKQANFVLGHEDGLLRLRHGLTELRSSGIPVHRVQALELRQPLPWRPLGWWSVHVNVAGVGHGEESETTILPVGTVPEALAVVALVQPHVPAEDVVAALQGTGPAPGWVVAPSSARRLDPLGWRRRGYTVSGGSVVTRRGVLLRAAQLVPHARVQSLTIEQGPWQRSLGLATIALVSTPGPVVPRVDHLGVADATALLNEQAGRSRRARRST